MPGTRPPFRRSSPLHGAVTAIREASSEPRAEYENNGKSGKRWTKIGAAFPHKEGIGFSIELKSSPMDGRLVVLPPDPTDDRSK